VVLACLLPLLVCVYVLWSVGRRDEPDSVVTELLVQELVSDRPMLLPSRRPVLACGEEGKLPGGQPSE